MRFLVCFLAFTTLAQAEDPLQTSQQALTDPAKRQEALSDPDALAAMQSLEKLAGSPQNSQKIYELAAELMATLASDANGDPAKMMDILQAAQKDPAAFGNKFTPAQQAKLREIAKAIEGSKLP